MPGAPSPVIGEPIIMRLYDEIREMRTEVTGMRSDIRELNTTMHTAMAQVGDHETRIREVERTVEPMKDHEQRITSMEKKVWAAAGVMSLISAGSAVAGTLLAMGR